MAFMLEVGLCSRYPALTPFSVRRERFHDVVMLYIRTIRHERMAEETKQKAEMPDGSFELNGILYKPAENDDWY